MRPRLLVALVLAAGLAAAYFVSGVRREAAPSANRVASFDGREVTALALTTGGESCRVVRDGSGWRLTAPQVDVASASAVEEIIVAAGRAPVTSAMPDAVPSAAFGLTPPQTHLAFEGVQSPEIDIGARIPTGDGLYARLSGRPGVVVLRLPDAAPLATARCGLLRDPSLLGAQASEIESLELAPEGTSLRKDRGAWWIEKPRRLAASPARVDPLVAALARASIVAWDDGADGSDPRFGLVPGRRVAWTAGGKSGGATFGAPAGEGRLYATREGRHGVLTVAIPALPSTSAEALRESKLTNVNRYRVVELVYESGARRFAATRIGAAWTSAAGTPLQGDAMLALLVALLEAPTASCDAGALPAGPHATISYATDDGAHGRIDVVLGLAAWSEAPGSVFRLASPLPPVP